MLDEHCTVIKWVLSHKLIARYIDNSDHYWIYKNKTNHRVKTIFKMGIEIAKKKKHGSLFRHNGYGKLSKII